MYRIVLACSGIPSNEGPAGAEGVREEFTHRPWHKNVKCEWNGAQLILHADNDYDSNGKALVDEDDMHAELCYLTEAIVRQRAPVWRALHML